MIASSHRCQRLNVFDLRAIESLRAAETGSFRVVSVCGFVFRLGQMIARVTLEIALRKEFDYLIPPGLEGQVDAGTRVQVPFGPRKVLGVVTALAEESAHARLRPILKVIGAPTVREPDGLAMSSRNVYLSPEERMAAAKIYRSLASARSLKEAGETRPEALVEKVRESLKRESLIKVEYVEVVSAEGARIQRSVTASAVIALAVRIGKTRLIDNIVV